MIADLLRINHMRQHMIRVVVAALLMVAPALAQNPPTAPPAAPQDGRQGLPGRGRGPAPPPGPGRSNNPFPAPIPATEGLITVNFVEFASLPDAGPNAGRMDLLLDEPGTHRIFVNTMQGLLYSVSYDGKTVKPYLDLN